MTTHVRIRNSSKNAIIIGHKPVEQVLGQQTILATVEGQFVPVESVRKANKVMDTVVIPGASRVNGPGELVLTKAEFRKLDETALQTFDRVLSIQEIDQKD